MISPFRSDNQQVWNPLVRPRWRNWRQAVRNSSRLTTGCSRPSSMRKSQISQISLSGFESECVIYWVSPKPDIICFHISAGSNPHSFILDIIFCIIFRIIFDIIFGIALVAMVVMKPPAIALISAIRMYRLLLISVSFSIISSSILDDL